MASSTGPVLAIGGITMANNILFNKKEFDFRVPIATLIAAGAFGLIEHAAPRVASALAWTALAVVVLTRVDPKVPSPVESLAAWWRDST